MNRLRFHAQLDREGGTCLLFVGIDSAGFSGTASSNFLIDEVDRFGAKLEGHSLPRDSPAVLAGGYWDQHDEGRLLETHLYVAAYPVDTLNGVGVRVRLSTPPHQHDRPESIHRVEAEIQTNYGLLAEFGREIRELVQGLRSYVVLVGHPKKE